MNAILSIPPKFFAVFSKRLKMRRFSLSQPINRSTTLRLRYSRLLNFTPRSLWSWFCWQGITG